MTQRPMRRSKRVTTRLSGQDGYDQENEEPIAKKVKRDEPVQEEDGGFMFTRKRALRPRKSIQRAEADPPSSSVLHHETEVLPKPKRRKQSQPPVAAQTAPQEEVVIRRRSSRRSKEPAQLETVHQNGHPTPPSSDQTSKVALPLSDTPVIRKNREFRKTKAGARRSSVGMRGHRASSLIDSGHSAIPHDQVGEKDFHKHIASDMPEPRRMRQLLTWCGTRALGQKQSYSSAEGHARAVARVIQEELLKDFNDRAELSDWFSREESNPIQIFKRPNPRNEQNLKKIQECEERLAALRAEQDVWKGILNQPVQLLAPEPNQSQQQPDMEVPDDPIIEQDLRHLEPPELAYLTSLRFTDPDSSRSAAALHAKSQRRLDALTSKLEFHIDSFADGAHTIGQYQDLAEKVATRVLANASQAWAKRDQRLKQSTGTDEVSTHEVLRKLSRIDHND